jgi:hypothetical protein
VTGRTTTKRLAALLCVTLAHALVVAPVPVAAQDDVCAALAPEELEAVVGVPFEEGSGFEGYCSWEAATAEGTIGISVLLQIGTLSEIREQSPDGQDLEVLGRAAYAVEEDLGLDLRGAVAAAAFQPVADAVYVEATDPTLDVLSIAIELLEVAGPRLAEMELVLEPDELTSQPEACSVFDPVELGSILGEPLTERRYGDAVCAWESASQSTSFAAVSLTFDVLDLPQLRADFPGGEDVVVGGLPGYLYTVELEDSSQASLSVDLGPDSATLSIVSPDPGFDAAAAASELIATALGRGIVVGEETVDAPSPCSWLTRDEAAQALGLELEQEVLDYGTACSYFAGQGEFPIEILLSALEVEEATVSAEGTAAEPVPDLGDAAWWSEEFATLYAYEGERAFSVLVSGGSLDSAERLSLARSLTAALLDKLAQGV